MTKRRYLIAASVLILNARAGVAQPSITTQRTAMAKLDYLVGQWSGDGWVETNPNQRRTFKAVEIAQLKLDGLLLTMDGMHRGQVDGKGEERVIHHAFAMVNYDDKNGRYRFQGFTAMGNHVDGEAKVVEGHLIWNVKIQKFGDVRYTIKSDDKDRWSEIGEVTQDGKSWRKYFEMTMNRVSK
jgi:hypothetical protein